MQGSKQTAITFHLKYSGIKKKEKADIFAGIWGYLSIYPSIHPACLPACLPASVRPSVRPSVCL
jgi:hypothetical protein